MSALAARSGGTAQGAARSKSSKSQRRAHSPQVPGSPTADAAATRKARPGQISGPGVPISLRSSVPARRSRIATAIEQASVVAAAFASRAGATTASAAPPCPTATSTSPICALNCQPSSRRTRVVLGAPAAQTSSVSMPSSVTARRQACGSAPAWLAANRISA